MGAHEAEGASAGFAVSFSVVVLGHLHIEIHRILL